MVIMSLSYITHGKIQDCKNYYGDVIITLNHNGLFLMYSEIYYLTIIRQNAIIFQTVTECVRQNDCVFMGGGGGTDLKMCTAMRVEGDGDVAFHIQGLISN